MALLAVGCSALLCAKFIRWDDVTANLREGKNTFHRCKYLQPQIHEALNEK